MLIYIQVYCLCALLEMVLPACMLLWIGPLATLSTDQSSILHLNFHRGWSLIPHLLTLTNIALEVQSNRCLGNLLMAVVWMT